MNSEEARVDQILRALQERAKELNCLYRVDELVRQPGIQLDEILRGIVEILPQGWQYSRVCQARIRFEDLVVQTPGYVETPFVQSAPIVVQGQPVGLVQVSYTVQMPGADEGPFLKDERRLIDTIAERVASIAIERRLRTAFAGWQAALAGPLETEKQEWWVVLEFLRGTDPTLLRRISRKMINHLSWSGVQDARELVSRFAVKEADEDSDVGDENRPLRRGAEGSFDLTAETFRIAGRHLGDAEILACLTKWIKEEKSSFLVNAVENQETPLGGIFDAIERYRSADVDENELSPAIQTGLRASLCRRLFSENREFINVAKKFIHIKDFYDLLGKVVLPPRCHGKLGGKSAGLFLAKKIIEKSPQASAELRSIKVPRTWYIPSDGILHFIHYNNLEDVLTRKYMDLDQIRQEYPHLVQLFKHSAFPPAMAKGLAVALDDFEDRPIIVRSSSLLEDRAGSAFSGKYKSLFLGNRGAKQERMAALCDAIAEVYASIFGPDPTEYRAERGLLDLHEEMGILIQEVVGQKVGKYFFPVCSGVAFSNNEFRWSARIRREDGLIRLVPGLGTRAVDRVADDYPVLIAPGQPGLRVNVTVDEVFRYSPKKVDVINLETNAFETVDANDLIRECGADYPAIRRLVSIIERDRVRQPIGARLNFENDQMVFTFEGLIKSTPFVARSRELLDLLRRELDAPVDIEFAADADNFYLLQCRVQSYGADAAPAAIPQDLPADKVLFSANRYVSNGKVPEITHVVYVDPEQYNELSDPADMREVGRAVSRMNKVLPKRQFILIGPGRWGSRGDIRLGVPVTYSDINNTAMLIEVARQKGNYLPDLSFGTHFFQDLVEASIRYLPLYPDDPQVAFADRFFTRAKNVLAELAPEFAGLSPVVRVIDVPQETGGQIVRVLMNADIDQAVAFLSTPKAPGADRREFAGEVGEKSAEEHWRWRHRMAQRIAAQIEPQRSGVVGVYLFGSTKNATAGPGSDIDLLVHFRGDETQRAQLTAWLSGWSKALAEMNFLRTGYKSDGLLDVHFVTDEDIARQDSYAIKINAVTDPARPLEMGAATN